jgi:hypothetical protein
VLFGDGRFVRWRGGSSGWRRLGRRRLASGRLVIGGLLVGGADGVAPGIDVVGVDVFVLGEVQGLDAGGGVAATAKSRSLAALGMTQGRSGPSRWRV